MWNLRLISTFILFLVILIQCQASDSIQSRFQSRYLNIKIDNRRTHIHDDFTVIWGLNVSWRARPVLRFKTGINLTPFETGEVSITNPEAIASRLFFFSLGEEYDYLKYKRLTLTSYLQGGYGWHFSQRIREFMVGVSKSRTQIIPIEIGSYGSYKIWPWLDFKLGGGWRWVLLDKSQTLSNYYFQLGFGIRPSEYVRKKFMP